VLVAAQSTKDDYCQLRVKQALPGDGAGGGWEGSLFQNKTPLATLRLPSRVYCAPDWWILHCVIMSLPRDNQNEHGLGGIFDVEEHPAAVVAQRFRKLSFPPAADPCPVRTQFEDDDDDDKPALPPGHMVDAEEIGEHFFHPTQPQPNAPPHPSGQKKQVNIAIRPDTAIPRYLGGKHRHNDANWKTHFVCKEKKCPSGPRHMEGGSSALFAVV